MMRVSAGVMASVVFGSVIGFAAAQTVAPPTCTTERGDYRGCALFAGGVPDLRGMTFAHGESELRFYLGSGNVFPERLLILHQTPDTTTARLFLIWPASIITDSFARSRCGETWSNTTGGLCVGQLDSTRDWRAVLRRLDDLGLQRIPGDPAKTRPPCHQDQRTASGNFIGCGVSGDGPVYDLAYRSEWVYWTYGFPSVAGPKCRGAARRADLAVAELRGSRPGSTAVWTLGRDSWAGAHRRHDRGGEADPVCVVCATYTAPRTKPAPTIVRRGR